MDHANVNNAAAAATISTIPDEILGLIIRSLPLWRARVRVEKVSPRWRRVALTLGWTDVKYFDSWGSSIYRQLPLKPSWWGPLLDRMGPHLTMLRLSNPKIDDRGVIKGTDGLTLTAALLKCPRLELFCTKYDLLEVPILDNNLPLRNVFSTLKSLKLDECHNTPKESAIREANKWLNYTTSLEYLAILTAWKLPTELTFQGEALANLRRAKLGWDVLSPGNIDVLTTLPTLRSFAIVFNESIARPKLSFLPRFQHLQHLELCGINQVQNFIEVLPQLGEMRKLKALEVNPASYLANSSQLLLAIASHLPQLEHLGLWLYFTLEHESAETVENVLSCLASPRLAELRSLCFSAFLPDKATWSWLEELSRRLEYLEVDSIPASTLCRIVRNGKRLRKIKVLNKQSGFNAEDRASLIYAAKAAAFGDKGDRKGEGTSPLPTLFLGAKLSGPATPTTAARGGDDGNKSRLRFVHAAELVPDVLNSYRDGGGSAGSVKPSKFVI